MRVAIVAGEASGDYLGAGLIRAIRARVPAASFEGIAGPMMLEAGCETRYPMERLSVMGLFESFGRYPELIPLRRRLAREWLADPPDVFVGIDAPDFNLSLELALRRGGVPTVHYVSPSVWAWRRYRVRKIARAVNLVLTLFPFEKRFFDEFGVRARFVGHPLADEIPDETDPGAARRALGLVPGGELVALLPGSRMSEVDFLADPMARTARWLAGRRPGLRFVAPLVDAPTRERFRRALAEQAPDVSCTLVAGRSREAMGAADVVLLASGTAALEAMLIKRPMVITYRTMAMTWLIGRSMLHVDHVGLPNLLAGREVVPELLQEDAVPERLGPAVLGFLDDRRAAPAVVAEFRRMHRELRNDAAEAAAGAVLEVAAP